MKNLAGKAVIVTGGGSGLGQAIAERMSAEGCRIIVADIDRDSGGAVARTVRGSFLRTDVSAAAEVEAAVAFAVATQGRLDEVAHETWRRIIDINPGGVFFGMKYAIAQFMRQGGARVVVNIPLSRESSAFRRSLDTTRPRRLFAT